MKVSYTWLQSFFAEQLPTPDEIADKLTFGAFEIEGIEEVGDDTVIDVDVLPNRAHDALSHRGIAREISTLFELQMKDDPFAKDIPALEPTTDELNVRITDSERCTVYTTALIKGVKVGPSPEWLRDRLEAVGQKSINNVVDATNYIMFGLGAPAHAFDADKLGSSLVVRAARDGEKVTVLGGDEKELTTDMSVIADADSDTAIAVAGVKGGVHAELTESTTNVVLEVAKFHPTITRKAAQALSLRTDASKRFENEMSDVVPIYGMHALAQLVLEVAGGELIGFATTPVPEKENYSVTVTTSRVNALLGTHLSDDDVVRVLNQLQFVYTQDGETFTVQAPFERYDIRIPEDVVEEIGRVYGYNNIEGSTMDVTEVAELSKKHYVAEVVRGVLAPLGFTEVYTHALRGSGEVALANALASDKDHLRKNLAEGLVEALDKNEKNAPLLGLDTVRMFEVGNVFTTEGEFTHCAVAVRVQGKKKCEERTNDELTAAKDAIAHALGITLDNATIDGDVLEFNITDLDLTPAAYLKNAYIGDDTTFAPYSSFPFVLRDIAVWVPESVSADDVLTLIRDNAGELLVRTDLCDEFTKEGRTSYAFHLVFQAMDKTLTDDEVGTFMQAVEAAMQEKEWEVR